MLLPQQLIFMMLLELARSGQVGAPKQCRAVGFRIETTLDPIMAITHDRDCQSACIRELIELQQHLEHRIFLGPNMLKDRRRGRNDHGVFFRIDQCLAWPRYCTQLQLAFMTPLTPIHIVPENAKAQPAAADCTDRCEPNPWTIRQSTSPKPLSKCYCGAHLILAQVRKNPSATVTRDLTFCEPEVICRRLNTAGRLDLGRVNWQCQQGFVLDNNVACAIPANPCPCDGGYSRVKLSSTGSCRRWSMPLQSYALPQRFWSLVSGLCEPDGPPIRAATALRQLDEMNRLPQIPTPFSFQIPTDRANLQPQDGLSTLDNTIGAAGTSTREIGLGENRGLKRTSSQASLDSLTAIDYDEFSATFDFGTAASSVVSENNLLVVTIDNTPPAALATVNAPDNPPAIGSEDDQMSVFGELQPILDLGSGIDAQGHEGILTAEPNTGDGRNPEQRCYCEFL